MVPLCIVVCPVGARLTAVCGAALCPVALLLAFLPISGSFFFCWHAHCCWCAALGGQHVAPCIPLWLSGCPTCSWVVPGAPGTFAHVSKSPSPPWGWTGGGGVRNTLFKGNNARNRHLLVEGRPRHVEVVHGDAVELGGVQERVLRAGGLAHEQEVDVHVAALDPELVDLVRPLLPHGILEDLGLGVQVQLLLHGEVGHIGDGTAFEVLRLAVNHEGKRHCGREDGCKGVRAADQGA